MNRPEEQVVRELSVAECWDKLAENRLGRVVVNTSGSMDIFPVNYAVDRSGIYFSTAPGSKLVTLTIHSVVLFEADLVTAEKREAWSVVARGRAQHLRTAADIHYADGLAIRPWVETPKYEYVRIAVQSITGRLFRLSDNVSA
ncbi:pyridoxamine 5'-phosphate oxidase family protein [Nocardia colli]|uniref:pyridoxamine 5'-phosphate oxidase family protein n=1 Tax=Nocardia colli TaxID=2545717 RepID=UPI0035DBFF83